LRERPASDWLSGTPLEVEHHKLMRGRYPDIDWARSTAGDLTPAQRERVGLVWRRRLVSEYLAISTFSVLSIDLCAARAPADVLSLVHRAAIDEIRHAEYCCRLAELYGGQPVTPEARISNLPDDRKRPRVEQALSNALLVSAVAETYATVVLGAVRERTTDPVAHAVMDNIYADEVQHARIGWSYLAYCLEHGGAGERAAAERMIPIAIQGCANVVEAPRPTTGPVDEALAAHGMMSPEDERVLFVKSIREVLAPGFHALGLSTGNVLTHFDDAWAASPPTSTVETPQSL
jgi:hypothetical protein